MKAATVRFHDQAGIPPEKVRLERAVPHIERNIDFGSRQSRSCAHAQEQSLQFAAGSLGVRMDLIEQHAQSSHAAPAPASPNQTSQARVIKQPQHLCLRESLPQIPDWDNSRKVQQRSRQTGAGDPVECRPILAGQAVVPVCIDTARDSSASHGRGHIDRRAIIAAYAPEGGGGPMRQHRSWAAGKDRRHPSSVQVHAGESDRVDPMVDPVKRPAFGSLVHCRLSHPKAPQLIERDQPVLPRGNPRNLRIPTRRRSPPTGRKPHSDSGFSPVGGWFGGFRGHTGRLAYIGARVVRGSHREARGFVPKRERPGFCRASRQSHSPVETSIRLGGVLTSCRPYPAYRRAFRHRRRLPSRAARR